MQYVWLAFAFGTVLCWGTYGPVIHAGQANLGNNGFRALLCVGGAYFVLAVIIPFVVLTTGGSGVASGFTTRGALFALAGGALGAMGAFCIIWSFKNGGRPIAVMPLVFAGAPIVNAIISISTHPPEGGLRSMDWRFFVGSVLAATGAYMVLAFKPS